MKKQALLAIWLYWAKSRFFTCFHSENEISLLLLNLPSRKKSGLFF